MGVRRVRHVCLCVGHVCVGMAQIILLAASQLSHCFTHIIIEVHVHVTEIHVHIYILFYVVSV